AWRPLSIVWSLLSSKWWRLLRRLRLRSRRGRLLLLFVGAQHVDLERGRIDREGHHRRDDLRRVLEGLRHLDQRPEWPVDVDVQPQRNLREHLVHEPGDEAMGRSE